MEKKLDDNYTRMLWDILNKSWREHPTKQQLYGHLAPIMKTIQIRCVYKLVYSVEIESMRLGHCQFLIYSCKVLVLSSHKQETDSHHWFCVSTILTHTDTHIYIIYIEREREKERFWVCYLNTHTHTHTYIHIYIYREREREVSK